MEGSVRMVRSDLCMALWGAGGSDKVLYPASTRASTNLQDSLASSGFQVTRIHTYNTVSGRQNTPPVSNSKLRAQQGMQEHATVLAGLLECWNAGMLAGLNRGINRAFCCLACHYAVGAKYNPSAHQNHHTLAVTNHTNEGWS